MKKNDNHKERWNGQAHIILRGLFEKQKKTYKNKRLYLVKSFEFPHFFLPQDPIIINFKNIDIIVYAQLLSKKMLMAIKEEKTFTHKY